MTGDWRDRRLHLIGVGGAGMSAYARAAHALGARVTGSDRARSVFSDALAADGVLDVLIGHRASNLPPGTEVEVVFSSAIPAENPERIAALERGMVVRPRADLLGELTALRRTIAVAGAHGKTTTAAMIVCALRAAGREVGYLIGGTLRETGRNADWGTDEWLVVEADESDRSLLSLDVEIAVLTNVELDHHERYASLAELEEVYRAFLAGAPRAVVWDRAPLRALRAPGAPLAVYDVLATTLDRFGSHWVRGDLEISVGVPGAHNALNGAAALAVCELLGVDLRRAAAGLARFAGTGRRFEHLGRTRGGAEVYDDYAHHPTEVAATLAAARTLGPRRLIALFQPHLYSRTRELAPAFGAALCAADVVVVLDIYPARERAEDFPGVSGRLIADAARRAAGDRPVHWLGGDRDGALALLGTVGGVGDVIVVMGAGDVGELSRALACAGDDDD